MLPLYHELALHAPLIAWLSAVIVSAALLGARYNKIRSAKSNPEDGSSEISTRTPTGYSLAQLITRTLLLTAAVLDFVHHAGASRWGETAALAYAFALDVARVLQSAKQPELRAALLHHVNALVLVEAIVSAAHLLPGYLFLDHQPPADIWLLLKFVSAATSIAVAAASPRQWTPPPVSFGLAQRDVPQPSPEQTSPYFSFFISYSWMTPTILRGWGRRLLLQDTLPLPEYDEPLIWKDNIMAARQRYKTTAKTIAFALRHNIAAMVFFAAFTAAVDFVSPLALYCLLNHIQNPHASTVRPWLWVALLFIGPILRSLSYQRYIFNSTRLIVRLKLGLIQELYAKAGRCYDSDATRTDKQESQSAPLPGTTKPASDGKSDNVTTLVAYDVNAICNSRDFILVSTSSPIQITVSLVFLYILFGLYSLVALVLLLLSFPLAGALSRLMSHFQRALMRYTDVRVSAASEYLSSMRTIKYLGWEPVMADRLNQERRQEETQVWRRNLAAVAVTALGEFVPLLALFAMFAVYTLRGHPLTAAKAFTSVTIIEALRLQFVWMASVTRFYSQARVAFSRIDKFMLSEQEIKPHAQGDAAFHSAVFRRALDEDTFRLHIDCQFVPGGLNAIAGASGSGKTTLLLSLLGETVLESGSATCPKPVSYASQIPWLLNDTVRANVLMHQDFDEPRYIRTLYACALLPDLESVPEGDLTEVGVNGSNLSGGQRQRVGLARALYARSSILVLDDIFSALDAATQKHIWDWCFCDDAIIQGRTVILVTQFQAARDAADLLLELSNGEVTSTTTRTHRQRPTKVLPPNLQQPSIPGVAQNATGNDDFAAHHVKAIQNKINQEVGSHKRNPRNLFYHYMLLFGGNMRVVLTLLLCFLLQFSFFSQSLWLSIWVGASPGTDGDRPTGFYVGVYAAILLSFATFSVSSQVNLQAGAWKAAHRMHEKLVSAAMWVSVNWYDKNPPGRFINRLSSDMFSMDCIVIDYLRNAINNSFRFVLRLTAIGSIMPIFALPAAVVCAVGLLCAEMYTRAQLSIKTLSSASQSPIFSFFEESMSGRAVIRSGPGFQRAFAEDLGRRLRIYARSSETQFNLNRWVCVRADGCAAVIALATGMIAVSYSSDVSAGRLGFSLTSAVGLGQTILTLVRSMNDLEAELNCFYRVREYASLPHEDDPVDDKDRPDAALVPESWPSAGEVVFRNATVKYALDGPDILRNVSLKVSHGERVAIVGRTGSGKSTLALSLLGFTNVTGGAVLIDGVDLASVPFRVLRRRLTIIPQEPVLFGGDVRFNLDPARIAASERLTEAIGACSALESLAGSGADGRDSSVLQPIRTLDLDTTVAPQGSNFSVGQRQVLSLARATVRQSQVVILDEATASIDYKSDVAIQEVLRSAFRGRTIIAIVHRLSTIMDYDRVVVMDAGQVREVGSPVQLFQQGGLFQAMVQQSIEHGKGSEWTPEKLQKLKYGEQ